MLGIKGESARNVERLPPNDESEAFVHKNLAPARSEDAATPWKTAISIDEPVPLSGRLIALR